MIKRITTLTIFLLIIIASIFLFLNQSKKEPADNKVASAPEQNISSGDAEKAVDAFVHQPDSKQKEPVIITETSLETSASQNTIYEKPLIPEINPAVQQKKPSFDVADDHISKNFQQNDGSHFTVKFEGSLNAATGQIIGILLEEAYMKIGVDLGYYPDDKITAVLYSKEQFSDVTRSPSWVSALYDGRIKLPVGGITQRTSLLEKVLFHEYTHAIVHRLSRGKSPTWLNEGIAQYEDGTRDREYAGILPLVARGEISISMNKLEGSFMGFDSRTVQAAYGASISVTEYIINDFGINAVRNILERLGNGETLESSILNSLHISYAVLQTSWMRNLKNRYG